MRQQFFDWQGASGNWTPERALSIVQLIENHMLDVETAALLWLFVERKASLIVAAMPRLAGKTTLLMALLGLRPAQYEVIETQGIREDFSFLERADPSRTYILCNELSDHLPMYLPMRKARTLFEALEHGHSFAATMHAQTAEDVVEELVYPPASVPQEAIPRLALVVNLIAGYSRSSLLRRVREVTLIEAPADRSAPFAFRSLAAWDEAHDSFHTNASKEANNAIGARLGLQDAASLAGERAALLLEWLDAGTRDFDAVRQAALAFYEGGG